MHRHLFAAVCGLLLLVAGLPARAEFPRNVILFVGDGMGFGHVEAAASYRGAPLPFELLPYQGTVTTHSANSDSLPDKATDSAAAATAMATGRKVNNGVLSIAKPGDGSELRNLVEIYAWGAGASRIGGIMDNTDIFRVASVPEPATWVLFVLAGVAVLCRVTRRKRGPVQ